MGNFCGCIDSSKTLQESTVEVAQTENSSPSKRPQQLSPAEDLNQKHASSPDLSPSTSPPPRKLSYSVIPPPVDSRPGGSDDFEGFSGDFIALLKEQFGQFAFCGQLEDGLALIVQAPIQLLDGTVYTGEWNCHWQRHGRGREDLPDGSRYVGFFKEDQRHGKGRMICPNTSFYEGDFKQGLASGYGVYFRPDGSQYSGQFKSNLQNGRGKEVYPNGSQYKGNFRHGHKEGQGIFTWPDGSKYSGDFHNNLQEGQGTLVWTTGKSYRGGWRAGKMHGTGVFTWADGRQYRGQYSHGVKHGAGTFVWPSGKLLEGTWVEGVQDGVGTLRASKHDRPQLGLWRRGQFIRWNNKT